jgi:hypothetical protein
MSQAAQAAQAAQTAQMAQPAQPAGQPTIVIHNHYERMPQRARGGGGAGSPLVALAADVSGPAWGTVHRNAEGHITDVNGVNLALGWSWKRYGGDVARPLCWYRTLGTVGLLVPHFEVGVDYKRQM